MTLGPREKRERHNVHRLVAAAFLGPANGREVNHIDGDKANNAVSNLEYVTRSENMRHAVRLRLTASGERCGSAKVNWCIVAEMRARAASGAGRSQLAREYGISRSNVRYILQGATWKHIAP